MGQKTHPKGFRLGTSASWNSSWFRKGSSYVRAALEDWRIRNFVGQKIEGAGLEKVEIKRFPKEVKVILHVARPGMVIGRGGRRIEDLKKGLSQLTSSRLELKIEEVRGPQLSAPLVAERVVRGVERGRSPNYVLRRAAQGVMEAGAQGIKIEARGRLGGSMFARKAAVTLGSVPTQTLRADIDFAQHPAHTKCGLVGIKVWIYKGEKEI